MAANRERSHALDVTSSAGVGMLITVDADGAPHGRWMAAMPLDGLSRVICLTAHGTRKVQHIRANPRVCWVFSDEALHETVKLSGEAVVSDNLLAAQAGWDHLASSTRQYLTGPLSNDEDLEMVLIETKVAAVELISHELGFVTPTAVPLG